MQTLSSSSSPRLDRAILLLSGAATAVMLPGVAAPYAIQAGVAYIALCCGLAACTTAAWWRGGARDVAVAAFRVASAVGQVFVRGGRVLPTTVKDWRCFIFGRSYVFFLGLHAACLRLGHRPPLLLPTSALTLAATLAQQRAACASLIHGFKNSQFFFERLVALARSAVDASLAVTVGAAPRRPPPCQSDACTLAMTYLFTAAVACGTLFDLWLARRVASKTAALSVLLATLCAVVALDASTAGTPCAPLPRPPPEAGVELLTMVERLRLYPRLVSDALVKALGA